MPSTTCGATPGGGSGGGSDLTPARPRRRTSHAGRFVVPVLLAFVAIACGVMALRSGPPPPAPAASERPVPPPAADAPLLSARRVPALLAASVTDRHLRDELNALVTVDPDPSCLTVGIGGRTIFESAPDIPLAPASTLKLLTARAALAELGADSRFRTEVVSAGPVAGGIIEGDLWVVGAGDPLLATRAWAERLRYQPAFSTPLEVLADRIRDAGVREVRGALVGDDSRYDGERYVPTWPDRYVTSGQTGPLSALSVDDGFLWPGGTAFTDPPAGATAVLTRLLQERGIVVVGLPRAGPAPGDATAVASIESPTVGEIVGQMLRDSDNGTAELLVKELGVRVSGEGSTRAGTDAVRAHLEASGLPVEGLRMLDGSGLDPENRVTCRLLQEVLTEVEPGSPLDLGLPVGGRTGTLTTRFLDDALAERIRAKTGSIRAVAALAGFAEDDGDPTITFSYVVNGMGPLPDAGPLYDALATVLVDYPKTPDPASLGPAAYPAPT